MQRNRTTVHRYCCKVCGSSVTLEQQYGGDLTYQCTNPRCQKTVMASCADDALGKLDRAGRRLDNRPAPRGERARLIAIGGRA